MTFDEFYKAILEVLPAAQLDEDTDGQIVVYTDMMIATMGEAAHRQEVVPYVPTEDE
jgi:hypothetical protein